MNKAIIPLLVLLVLILVKCSLIEKKSDFELTKSTADSYYAIGKY
jgi:hypothetical protein